MMITAMQAQRRRDDIIHRVTHVGGRILLYATLIGCSLWFIAPLFWMFMSSFMPLDQVGVFPVQWIPRVWQFHNYTDAMEHWDFGTTFRNTVFITIVSLVGHVSSSTIVAYGFARFRFPGRDALFLILLATMMLPFAVLLIPVYVAYSKIGWINTSIPCWCRDFFGRAFFIFICRQFFLGIPQDLIDAAKIDGASELRIFTQIMIPLARPAIVVICILSFQGTWNDFLGPLDLPARRIVAYAGDRLVQIPGAARARRHLQPANGGISHDDCAGADRLFPLPAAVHPGANISGLKG